MEGGGEKKNHKVKRDIMKVHKRERSGAQKTLWLLLKWPFSAGQASVWSTKEKVHFPQVLLDRSGLGDAPDWIFFFKLLSAWTHCDYIPFTPCSLFSLPLKFIRDVPGQNRRTISAAFFRDPLIKLSNK